MTQETTSIPNLEATTIKENLQRCLKGCGYNLTDAQVASMVELTQRWLSLKKVKTQEWQVASMYAGTLTSLTGAALSVADVFAQANTVDLLTRQEALRDTFTMLFFLVAMFLFDAATQRIRAKNRELHLENMTIADEGDLIIARIGEIMNLEPFTDEVDSVFIDYLLEKADPSPSSAKSSQPLPR